MEQFKRIQMGEQRNQKKKAESQLLFFSVEMGRDLLILIAHSSSDERR